MTIIVAYVPTPEGLAALDEGIKIAAERMERLLVVNAGPGGNHEDPSLVMGSDGDDVQRRLDASGLNAEYKQFVRGVTAVDEILALVDSEQASLVVIGLRRRSAVGKLLLGSKAQEILLATPCPVLCVKAHA